MSTAKDVGTAISDRLKTIKIEDGFLTDAGLRVYRGRLALDASRIPCIVMVEGVDTRKDERPGMAAVLVAQPFTIEGHVACDPDNPNDAAHDVIADIKKAIFGGDIKFDGKIRKIHYEGKTIVPREDGTALVAGSISITADFSENLANP